MIKLLDREKIKKIHNDIFRKDVEKHIEAYENFMEQARESGIETDGNVTSLSDCSAERLGDVPDVEKGNSGHSLSYGHLSPACVHCRTGKGSKTVFHTLKCNRDCYFCANMNQENYDYFVDNINEALNELSVNDTGEGFRSIALTGGEPLLLPDKAVEFITECRKAYPEAHLRIYSNGDFLTEELAKALANAGLDEIRISVKADDAGYPHETVEKVRLAAGYIPSAMVEMPVIPGTLEVMKKLLTDLDSAGCKGINILEFLYPWINNDKFKERGFKVKEQPYNVFYDYHYAGGLPVSGSEEECLELLKFAAEEKLGMGVHYCSLENKLTSQIYGQNTGVKLMPYELLSEKDHFIKTVRVYGSNATKALKYFTKHRIDDYLSESNGLKVEFHPRLLREIKGITEAALTYNVVEEEDGFKTMREIKVDFIDPENFDYSNDI